MALTPRLELRQSQSLVMTPQLQQAIKLLQFSNIELDEYVEQELEQNPLLERGDDDYGIDGGTDDAFREDVGEAEDAPLRTMDLSASDVSQMPDDAALDMDYNTHRDNDCPSDAEGDFSQGAGLGNSSFAEWGRRGGGGGLDEDSANL